MWRTSSLSANGTDCVQVAVVNGSDSHESHGVDDARPDRQQAATR
ncbi:hypothetical protein ACFQVD_20885 [Streptosporangium amethystogenes subsp. fukuiense]|uniref:DUF397 domain-containing protein n=1 Tax=Streptosporangium amethystogenes subsp. fukuiense TaxID=698418 RepID=A0ABW2T2N0_9ACTN